MPDATKPRKAGKARPNDLQTVRYSLGGEGHGKCRRQETTWAKLRKSLVTPERTNEKHARYLAMSANDRAKMKARPGWIASATFRTGRRRASDIVEHGLITFDLDEATPELLEMLTEEGGTHDFRDYEYQLYTTRSHTPGAPRLRVVMPVTRTMPTDEWAATTRYLAQMVDGTMEAVDHVSFRSTQLMYKPSASADQEFIEYHNRGKLVDPDEVLAPHPGWRDFATLPQGARERMTRQSAAKAEVPTEKRGIVGDWCRTYTVEEAIDKFLPDIYGEGDSHETGKPRYTYLKGSAANGVVVEDGGLFIYSHHGTDPCGEKLCNAFDMVRLHLFGHLDAAIHDPDLPPGSYPSFKAMVEFALADEGCKAQIIASRLELIEECFEVDENEEPDQDMGDGDGGRAKNCEDAEQDDDGAILEEGLPSGTTRKRKRPPENWRKTLAVNARGELKKTQQNYQRVLANDERLCDRLVWDEMHDCPAVRYPIKVKSSSTDVTAVSVPQPKVGKAVSRLTDEDLLKLHSLLIHEPATGGYGFEKVAMDEFKRALGLACIQTPVHAVRDFCDAVYPEWDGIDRCKSIFVEYIGEERNSYTEQAGELVMVGMVARAYEPGCKWDYIPILQGPQGVRKSSFMRALVGTEWVGDLTQGFDDTNRFIEQTRGKVIVEIPELSAMKGEKIARVKEMVTVQSDTARLAYGLAAREHPRTVILWGTTNEITFLNDSTGHRRFWPLRVKPGLMIDTDKLRTNRRQLWAEAVHIYRRMRSKDPHSESLFLSLDKAAEEIWLERVTGVEADDPRSERRARVEAFLTEPVPLSQFGDRHALPQLGEPLVLRVVTCVSQVQHRALEGEERSLFKHDGGAILQVHGWQRFTSKLQLEIDGKRQKNAYVRKDATEAEIRAQYRIVGTYSGGPEDTDEDDPVDSIL